MTDVLAQWRTQAACAGLLDFGHSALDAKTCDGCPVKADCYAWAATDKNFEGLAGGKVWRHRRDCRAPKPRKFDGWTETTMRAAHANYISGQRTDWACEGERAYQAERKREARRRFKAECEAAA